MTFPNKFDSYTKTETDTLIEDIDYYTTDEVDDLIGSSSTSVSGIKAFGIVYDTNTSTNTISTTGETIGWDLIQEAYNLNYASGYVDFDNDSDMEYVDFIIETHLYFSNASSHTDSTSSAILYWGIAYSDNSGSSWAMYNVLGCGYVRCDAGTTYHIQNMKCTLPHSEGRRYALRFKVTDTDLKIRARDADLHDISTPAGTEYNVGPMPVKMIVVGY